MCFGEKTAAAAQTGLARLGGPLLCSASTRQGIAVSHTGIMYVCVFTRIAFVREDKKCHGERTNQYERTVYVRFVQPVPSREIVTTQ